MKLIFRHIMTNMGEKLTDEEASDMIACADSDAQGDIDYKGESKLLNISLRWVTGKLFSKEKLSKAVVKHLLNTGMCLANGSANT